MIVHEVIAELRGIEIVVTAFAAPIVVRYPVFIIDLQVLLCLVAVAAASRHGALEAGEMCV